MYNGSVIRVASSTIFHTFVAFQDDEGNREIWSISEQHCDNLYVIKSLSLRETKCYVSFDRLNQYVQLVSSGRRGYGNVRIKDEPKLPHQLHQGQLHFKESESHPNTMTWTSSKRHELVRVAGLHGWAAVPTDREEFSISFKSQLISLPCLVVIVEGKRISLSNGRRFEEVLFLQQMLLVLLKEIIKKKPCNMATRMANMLRHNCCHSNIS